MRLFRSAENREDDNDDNVDDDETAVDTCVDDVAGAYCG